MSKINSLQLKVSIAQIVSRINYLESLMQKYQRSEHIVNEINHLERVFYERVKLL